MDNAAKALIMAGAILISLALVGLGVYIFTISSDLQENTNDRMDALAIQMTNAELRNYEGNRVKGSTVRSFIDKIDILNIQEVYPVEIELDYTNFDKSTIVNNAYYTVTLTDENGDGYIDKALMTKN